jgi:hypothetical protein
MMRQILGGQRIKSHDTEFMKIQYVENGDAPGIASKISNIVPDKEIDPILRQGLRIVWFNQIRI